MDLIADTRQKEGKHKVKEFQLEQLGYNLIHKALKFGDYMTVDGRVSVDTKQSLNELWSNLTKDHARFKREMLKAREAGCVLVILVENIYKITNYDDLKKWNEAEWQRRIRHGKQRLHGSTIVKMCQTMSERYDVYFEFCSPAHTGERIHQMLIHQDWFLEQLKAKHKDD